MGTDQMNDKKVAEGEPIKWFLAKIHRRQYPLVDADRPREESLGAAELAPKLTIATESFVVQVAMSQRTHVATEPRSQVTLLLHGEIYNSKDANPARFLVEEYLRYGIDFAKDIDGSFAVLVMDGGKSSLALITDRLNSRRVFFSESPGTYWLSTSLKLHPTESAAIDPLGVVWYLTNGVIRNGRTLFDGIRVLEQASIHQFGDSGIRSRRYWSVSPPPPESETDQAKRRTDLSDLMIESVRRRISCSNPQRVFLSLSAGYDSIGVLGVLGSTLRVPDVRCFSYSLDESTPETDAHVAKKMATSLGYRHSTVNSYKGSLIGTIKLNANRGQGLAKFCDEADAWVEMDGDFSDSRSSVLFVGDVRAFSARDREPKTMRDALGKVRDFGHFDWLRGGLDPDTFAKFRDGLEDEISHLISRCPETDDLGHARDFFGLDRTAASLMPWREYFPGHSVTVLNPWLDNAMQDFMMETPASMKVDKRLYRETVMRMFPELFEVQRAQSMNYAADWGRELVTHRDAVVSDIRSQTSRLDSLLPPELLVSLVREHKSSNVVRRPTTHDIRSSRRKTKTPLIKRLLARAHISQPLREADRARFLMRAPVIRSFLSKD